MFVLVLLGAVVCVSAVPQADRPETSYNEVDTPVNQAPPVVAGIKFVRPAVAPTVLSRHVCEAICQISVQVPKSEMDDLFVGHPKPLQDLLCTFLV